MRAPVTGDHSKKDQMLSLNIGTTYTCRFLCAPSVLFSVVPRKSSRGANSMRVDEGRKGISPSAIKKKPSRARTVVGRREKSLLFVTLDFEFRLLNTW